MALASTQVSCCFTGNRPEKLPWGTNEKDLRCLLAQDQIYTALEDAYARGFCHFICGMARGSDLYFAELVLQLRVKYPRVTLEAAIPYRGQCDTWAQADKSRYLHLIEQCDKVTVLQEEYTPACMQRRNQYMVDHSSLVIALYGGMPGGTRSTLLYAMRQGVETMILSPE